MICDNTLSDETQETYRSERPLRTPTSNSEGKRMKKRLIPLVLAVMLVLLCGCDKPHDVSFTDTLPYSSKSGCSWVARLVSGSTGEVGISQTYRSDETYAPMGADGVIENVFTGLTPGIAIVRLYYVDASWDGFRSTAAGVAYYEFEVYDDLTINLLYSEVELPDTY